MHRLFSFVQWCWACWWYKMAWYQICFNIQRYIISSFSSFSLVEAPFHAKTFMVMASTILTSFNSEKRLQAFQDFFSQWKSYEFLLHLTKDLSLLMKLSIQERKINVLDLPKGYSLNLVNLLNFFKWLRLHLTPSLNLKTKDMCSEKS